ncbi:hypothetical protein BCY91_02165 [Pelobium manganitolerans]|uniref:Acetyltransferase n=1 Tax=Pelobium manganitolerans TaxID=1842495 RepID=A0A419SCL4_9SPHI|nr:CatB-related O-acetyltransferase [Pelobium manganitolerans]RKD20443.1 hypothetical protein BCY91_02165 [Pelobium manganitolerans]
MLKKVLANIVFSAILNFFTRISCFYSVRLNPKTFLYLLFSKKKDVFLRDAIIGSGVQLDSGCSFFNKPEVFGNVRIGRYTSISGPSTRICAEINEVRIGSFCSIASGVIIQEFYHSYQRTTSYSILSKFFKNSTSKNSDKISKGSVLIEDDVWIGSNAVILSGVTIGRGAIIGAGSIVTKDVKKYTIVAGNPAKEVKIRFSGNTVMELEESKWWTWSAEKIIQNEIFFTRARF